MRRVVDTREFVYATNPGGVRRQEAAEFNRVGVKSGSLTIRDHAVIPSLYVHISRHEMTRQDVAALRNMLDEVLIDWPEEVGL